MEALAQQLESDRNYRVLRRVPPVESWSLATPANDIVRGVVIDCETTGLGESDEVIELAVVPFSFCKTTGRVVAVHVDEVLAGFCEPEKPISAESTLIHGITQEMVVGHTITDEQVGKAVGDAKLALAFNAGFDRRMTGKTWPLLDNILWGCAYVDVDWVGLGLERGKQSFLLMKLGWFYEGHRALDDAMALLFLLTQREVLPSVIKTVKEPLYKVALRNTPYSCKDAIKARGGYQWDDKHPAGKNWWKCVSESDVEAETVWAQTICKPDVKRLPVAARHSSKLAEL